MISPGVWVGCTGVRLLHVPLWHVRKCASLFGEPCYTMGCYRGITCLLPNCLGQAVPVCSVSDARLVLYGFLRRLPVRALTLPAASVSEQSRGVKPGSRSRNKMFVAWLCVPWILTHSIRAPKFLPTPSSHPRINPRGQLLPLCNSRASDLWCLWILPGSAAFVWGS